MLPIISHIAIFVIALAFLAKGSDYFVEYAARIAKRLGVSDFVIGLTITSVGTSIPELAAAISAAVNHSPGLIIGNVTGSNIANIGLILGIAAALRGIKTDKQMYERDGYIMLASILLFFWFSHDNKISLMESIVFLTAYVFYVLFLIRSDGETKKYRFHDFMSYIFDFQYIPPLNLPALKRAVQKPFRQRTSREQKAVKGYTWDVLKDLGIIVLSLAAVTLGARFLIREAVWMAELINVPESVIGLSMIAVGTSLPELTVSISAVRQGRGELVVGNVLGSNIANVLLILGVSGSIIPLSVAEISVVYTIPILLFFSLALIYFIKSDWQITRRQGIVAILAYVVFMAMAFVMGWS